MSIFAEVTTELDSLSVSGWQRAVALALAEALDEKPNASMASELRVVMASLGSRATVKPAQTINDDLRVQREKRRAESRSAKSS